MKIESSQLLLSSQYQFSREKTVTESLAAGISRPGERWSEDTLLQGINFERNNTVRLYNKNAQFTSDENTAISKLAEQSATPLPARSNNSSISLTPAIISTQQSEIRSDTEPTLPQLDARLSLLVTLIESITGKAIKIIDSNALQNLTTDTVPLNSQPSRDGLSNDFSSMPSSEYGLRYQYSEQLSEAESSQFSAQGKIMTRDGKTINIDLNITMSRSFTSSFQIDIIKGAAAVKDPLVINFDSDSAKLTDGKINFDIDADGIDDNISFVSASSGFLVLDRNNDGRINNGRELFGALSGNGFSDLAQYDTDGNRFIDEGDAVFNRLKVWVRDEKGNNQLFTLAEKNIAAIYLQSSDTPFDLTDNNNLLLGSVRSTGLYITEDGQVKSIQQLDLVV